MLRLLGIGLATAATVLGASAAYAATEQTILPGYWHSSNTATLIITKKSEDRRCVTATQVSTFLSAPSNRHYKCVYERRSVHDGKLSLAGKCTDKHGTVFDVSINGTYSQEWFKLNARFSLDGLPIGGSATTEAHRISETCPVDSGNASGKPQSDARTNNGQLTAGR
jgi:hypothetical protein